METENRHEAFKGLDYKSIIDQLNEETREHSYSVSKICRAISESVGLDPDLSEKIGLLHDIGKIYIPSRILKKNGKLTSVEREVIDLHSYYGYRILKVHGEDPIVYIPVLFHHGFNKTRLFMEDEPISDGAINYTYLIHSVDIYDATMSKRSYHMPMSFEFVYKLLHEDPLCPDNVLQAIVKYENLSSLQMDDMTDQAI